LDGYVFDEESLDACAAARVSVPAVVRLLHGDRRLRRHIGTTGLAVTGCVDGLWLTVTLLETRDDADVYVVRDIYRLDDQQAAIVARILEGRHS
jgi:hypothetical protein